MPARLPQPGGDDGQWGEILNEFLQVAHNIDGSLKPIDLSQVTGLNAALSAAVPADGSITDAKVADDAAISADKLADGTSNKVLTAVQQSLLNGATILDTGSTLVVRSSSGQTNFRRVYSTAGPPVGATELTRKDYVDAATSDLSTATSSNMADTLVKRDGAGKVNVSRVFAESMNPGDPKELTRKDYVDTYGSASSADAAAVSGALDLSAAAFAPPKVRVLTLSGNVTVSNSPSSLGASRAGVTVLVLKQAASGGPYTVTWPATSSLPWAGGAAAPVMPTAANAELEVHLFWNGQSWRAKVGGTYFP